MTKPLMGRPSATAARQVTVLASAAPTAARLFGAAPNLPRVIELDIGRVSPNPDQARKVYNQEALDSLAASIEKHGLKYPILVSCVEEDQFQIVGGERRYRAHLQLGRPTIAAIITDGDTEEVGIIDNLQRVDLNVLEMASAFARLIKSHNYTYEELGRVVGRSKGDVGGIIGTLRLIPQIQLEYPDFASKIAARTMILISQENDPIIQLAAWERAKAGDGVVAIKTSLSEDARPLRSGKLTVQVPARVIARQVGAYLKSSDRQLAVFEMNRTALTEKHAAGLRILRDRINSLLGE